MGNCKLHTLNKRHNSTLQPTGTGTDTSVVLKGGSDMLSPVFTMHHNTFPTYNYVKYNGRYYFVTGIRAVHDDLFEISCEVDVLATYKASIQAISAYVLYYDHANTEIVDNRLSTKTTISEADDTAQFNNLGTGQSYMLTAVGENRTTIYACTQSVVDALFDTTILNQTASAYSQAITSFNGGIQSITTTDLVTFFKGLINFFSTWFDFLTKNANTIMYADDAQKFVKNCYVLPLAKANIGGSNAAIKLGKWDAAAGAEGNINFPRIVHDSATVTIPWQGITDWRRNEPYMQLYLYIPYIGLIKLPASELIGANTITVNVSIDTYSGVTAFVVNASNGCVIGQYSTNIAAPYAIGSSNISITESGAQIVTSAAAILTGAYSGNAAAIAGGALGLANAIKPFDASISSNGGAAGMGLGNTVKIFSVFHDTAVVPSNPSAVKGTPFNGSLALSGVSGYIQTSGASVAGGGAGEPAMTDTERQNINSLLDGGIYIE